MVFFSTPGTLLRLEGDALRVILPDRPGRHLVPLHRVESMVLWHGVDISSDGLRWCLDSGIHVTWITQTGKLHASLTGHEPGRPELRLAQARAHDNLDHRFELAKAMIAGKLQNYRQLLLRAARDTHGTRQARLRATAERHAEAVGRLPEASNLTEVLGIEGRAAREYFGSLDLVIEGVLRANAIGVHRSIPSTAICRPSTACCVRPCTVQSYTWAWTLTSASSTAFEARSQPWRWT